MTESMTKWPDDHLAQRVFLAERVRQQDWEIADLRERLACAREMLHKAVVLLNERGVDLAAALEATQ